MVEPFATIFPITYANLNILRGVGKIIQKGEKYAIIESNKTSTELISPLSGKIIAINSNLENNLSAFLVSLF